MKIEKRNTLDKGRGVFAAEDIPAGTKHISDCLAFRTDSVKRESEIHLYAFGSLRGAIGLIALDWTSFMNHSSTPNLKYMPNKLNQIEFETIRDIHKGEELLIDYKYDVRAHCLQHGFDMEEFNKTTQTT